MTEKIQKQKMDIELVKIKDENELAGNLDMSDFPVADETESVEVGLTQAVVLDDNFNAMIKGTKSRQPIGSVKSGAGMKSLLSI